jgi:hypothetical protein
MSHGDNNRERAGERVQQTRWAVIVNRHYLVRYVATSGEYHIKKSETFRSVPALIGHYKSVEGLCCLLGAACPRVLAPDLEYVGG